MSINFQNNDELQGTKNGIIVNMDNVQIYPETIASQVGFDLSNLADQLRNELPTNVQGVLEYAVPAYCLANDAKTRADSAYYLANDAYYRANNAYDGANDAYNYAGQAYGMASSANQEAAGAYTLASDAYSRADQAYELAYDLANNASRKWEAAYNLLNIGDSTSGHGYATDGTYTLKARVQDENVTMYWVKD